MSMTDKIRIVPHIPFVYRIERLFYRGAEEVWKTLGDLTYVMDRNLPVYKNIWALSEEVSHYKVLEITTFETVESAKSFLKEILEKEKKEEEFMKQEPVYV